MIFDEKSKKHDPKHAASNLTMALSVANDIGAASRVDQEFLSEEETREISDGWDFIVGNVGIQVVGAVVVVMVVVVRVVY